MTKKLIVAFLTTSLVALSLPARADSVDAQLLNLFWFAAAGYADCDVKGDMARLLHDTNGSEEGFPVVKKCIQEKQASMDAEVFSLIPLVQVKPKALKALLKFHSTWNSVIIGTEKQSEIHVLDSLEDAIQTVRTELAE